jgi:Fe2+ transport system protein B
LELAFRLTEQLAKRPSVDALAAKLKALESKHESLQQSLKESHERETRNKKELEEKHAQAMSEMAEKLKASNSRAKTLSTKLKATEAEATDIDELIFCKDFTIPICIVFFSPRPGT